MRSGSGFIWLKELVANSIPLTIPVQETDLVAISSNRPYRQLPNNHENFLNSRIVRGKNSSSIRSEFSSRASLQQIHFNYVVQYSICIFHDAPWQMMRCSWVWDLRCSYNNSLHVMQLIIMSEDVEGSHRWKQDIIKWALFAPRLLRFSNERDASLCLTAIL